MRGRRGSTAALLGFVGGCCGPCGGCLGVASVVSEGEGLRGALPDGVCASCSTVLGSLISKAVRWFV